LPIQAFRHATPGPPPHAKSLQALIILDASPVSRLRLPRPAAAFMLFLLLVGPTVYILKVFTQNLGFYIQNLPQLSF
jgi:hypothetical protein